MGQGHHTTKIRKQKWLAAYATTGTVLHACKEVGVARQTFYGWKVRDKKFAHAYNQAQEEVVEILEQEAMRRAKDGTLEPVYYQGKAVGAIRKYSDVLLIFLLNGLKPEKYKHRHEVSGPKGGPLEHLVSNKPLTRDELHAELIRRGLPTSILKD